MSWTNSRASRPRSPISAITLTSAEVPRAIMPSSMLLPTPGIAKTPIFWPTPSVISPLTARTPTSSWVSVSPRAIGSSGGGSSSIGSPVGGNRLAVERTAEPVEHAAQNPGSGFESEMQRATQAVGRELAGFLDARASAGARRESRPPRIPRRICDRCTLTSAPTGRSGPVDSSNRPTERVSRPQTGKLTSGIAARYSVVGSIGASLSAFPPAAGFAAFAFNSRTAARICSKASSIELSTSSRPASTRAVAGGESFVFAAAADPFIARATCLRIFGMEENCGRIFRCKRLQRGLRSSGDDEFGAHAVGLDHARDDREREVDAKCFRLGGDYLCALDFELRERLAQRRGRLAHFGEAVGVSALEALAMRLLQQLLRFGLALRARPRARPSAMPLRDRVVERGFELRLARAIGVALEVVELSHRAERRRVALTWCADRSCRVALAMRAVAVPLPLPVRGAITVGRIFRQPFAQDRRRRFRTAIDFLVDALADFFVARSDSRLAAGEPASPGASRSLRRRVDPALALRSRAACSRPRERRGVLAEATRQSSA